MQFKKIVFLTILPFLFFIGCNSKDNQNNSLQEESKKKSLPIFKLTTTTGKTLTLIATKDGIVFKEYINKAVLVNFFATWCPSCKGEIPHLNSLLKKYKEDFEIIGVLLENNKDKKELEDFIKEYKINYSITNTKENYKLAEGFGQIKAIPTMFIFNKSGKLVEKYEGLIPQEMMEIDIKRAIK